MREGAATRMNERLRNADPNRRIMEHEPDSTHKDGCPLCARLSDMHEGFVQSIVDANTSNPAVGGGDLIVVLVRTLAELICVTAKEGTTAKVCADVADMLTSDVYRFNAAAGKGETEVIGGLRELKAAGKLDPIIEMLAKTLGVNVDNIASVDVVNARGDTVASAPLSAAEDGALKGFSPEAIAMLEVAHKRAHRQG